MEQYLVRQARAYKPGKDIFFLIGNDNKIGFNFVKYLFNVLDFAIVGD